MRKIGNREILIGPQPQNVFEQRDPIRTTVLFLVGGLSFMFLMLSFGYAYAIFSSGQAPISLPIIFHANTVVILASSFTIHYAVSLLRQGEVKLHVGALAATFGLGFFFLVFQFIGWYELTTKGVYFGGGGSGIGNYLFLISGAHALHIVVGLGWLGYLLSKVIACMKDPVQELLVSTDPHKVSSLKLAAFYWHFVDVLWVYLYGFFLVNMLMG